MKQNVVSMALIFGDIHIVSFQMTFAVASLFDTRRVIMWKMWKTRFAF